MALLLVRGIPPVLKDCQIQEVHLQTEVKGWQTDDVLVVGTNGAGERRQLATQVKRRFTVSRNDEECKKAVLDFWADFMSGGRFDDRTDRFALVILRGTDTLLDKFNSLLDCARAAFSAADFMSRLGKPGHLSKTAQDQAADIRHIIATTHTVSDEEFWRFLRVVHVISLDLNTATGQSEAMMKSLLAQTAGGGDPVSAAEATWRELLELVGGGMHVAAGYARKDLPQGALQRHAGVASGDRDAMRALASHSETVLVNIRGAIADEAVLPRDDLCMQALASLDEAQVLVVSGPAGSGKSALAKRVVDSLRPDHVCLAFRAEEFADSHIDQALAFAGIGGERLLGLLAGQGRKVILVESVERLLEAPVRDAFSDLLRLAERDRSLKLVLTCRDYSLETVQASLLQRVSVAHGNLVVPPLTDAEVDLAAQKVPALARPTSHQSLRRLLKSPYFLDLAARVNWASERVLPSDERQFRVLCWRSVIRRDVAAGGGMPRRRERAFLEVALRRARELRPHVKVSDLDAEALEALRSDGLLAAPPDGDTLAAPSHDVLEDWAIMHWLDSAAQESEGDPRTLAGAVSGHPAVRRGYRKWLNEMLGCEASRIETLLADLFADAELPAFFRDDTIVAVLLSPGAGGFLRQRRDLLLADGGRELVRVIHLLRVACRSAASWLPAGSLPGWRLLEPQGEAWAVVLAITHENLDLLLPAHFGLVLGFVEDWALPLGWQSTEPPGVEDAGKIAFALLGYVRGYGTDDERKRVFALVAQMPHADGAAFEALLRRSVIYTIPEDDLEEDDLELGRDGFSLVRKRDRAAEELSDYLLTGMSAGAACIHFPAQMVRVARAKFLLHDQIPEDWGRQTRSGVERDFGIREHTGMKFFPASALRGPFLALLRSHPREGADFIIALMNHAAEWYGEQKWPGFRLEPAGRIELTLPDGATVTHWANGRWWQLYRGSSVAPYFLQSAAMALESWLLRACEFDGVDMDYWLLKILRESNNVGLTAVVASVCCAHPDRCPKSAVALLTAPELFELDRYRMVADMGGVSLASPLSPAAHRVYESERKQSGALPHRKEHLESLALRLQLTEQRDDVWQVLDRHLAALPPPEEQDDQLRFWRLALHRMDVRNFRIREAEPLLEEGDTSPDSADSADSAPNEALVVWEPGPAEPDVQELVEARAAEFAEVTKDAILLNWGARAWSREASEGCDPSDWRKMLAEARERGHSSRVGREYAQGGSGLVAAVCVRDHWHEMGQGDRAWCARRLIREIGQHCDTTYHIKRVSRGGNLFPDRPAAYALPCALVEPPKGLPAERITAAIAQSITHSVDEVAEYAADGIGYNLQGDKAHLALAFAGAVAGQARLLTDSYAVWFHMPYDRRASWDELCDSTALETRDAICSGIAAPEDAIDGLPLDDVAHTPARLVMAILAHYKQLPVTHRLCRRVAEDLVSRWDQARTDRDIEGHRSYEFETFCALWVARVAVVLDPRTAREACSPLLDAVERHPKEVGDFVSWLIYAADGTTGETSFWDLWQEFASRVCSARWTDELDDCPSQDAKLVRSLFLEVFWKPEADHWPRLDGNADRIHRLLGNLPPSSRVLDAYCTFLFQIGGRSLPQAFVYLQEFLQRGDASSLLANKNIAITLELLLGRHIYAEPIRLKSGKELRSAVLSILDLLVDAGSSVAFRMRDDFVTPTAGS